MSTQNQISSNSLSSSSSSSSSSLEKKPGTPENAGKESVSLPEHAKKRIASLNFTDQGNSSRKAFRTSGNQVEMSNKDVGIKQLRWTPAMDRCLLLVLAKEAREGKKGDKGFKKPSYARAASYVSNKFGVLCTADNVENRLRTTKKRYNCIMALQRNSEFGWDDTQKMITAHVQAYNDYIAVHPKAAQYLNRQIDMYDEMIIVCGKDQPTGSFDKSHAIVNVESADPVTEHEDFILDENIDAEETGEGMQFEKQQALTPDYSSSKARHHGKRSRSLEFISRKIDEIAKQIGEVAAALKNTRYQDISHVLYSEVMKSEGFNESFLASAFDYLNEHDTIARSFLAKSPNLRRKWLLKFHAQMVDSGAGSCI